MGWQVEKVYRSVKLKKKALVFSKEILNGNLKIQKRVVIEEFLEVKSLVIFL